MSILRDVLVEDKYFSYDDDAIKILDSYVESFPKDVQDKVSQLVDSAAAEIAIFQYIRAEAPDLPDHLTNANVSVTAPIAILTTRWYYCSPFDPPKCKRAEKKRLMPDTFGVGDIVIFTSDLFKIDALREARQLKELSDPDVFFAEVAKKSLEVSTWRDWAKQQGAHPRNLALVNKVQLALWRSRVDAIAGFSKEIIRGNLQRILKEL